jgi:hypothetical protein
MNSQVIGAAASALSNEINSGIGLGIGENGGCAFATDPKHTENC